MKKITILMSILIIALFSCGPSVEGESKNWKENIKQLKKLKKDYPAYASVIDENINMAEIVYNKAKSISEKEKKAEKMRTANDLLLSGCVGNIKNMKTKIAEINKKTDELNKLKIGKNEAEQILIKETIKDAKKTNKKALKVLGVKPGKAGTNPCDFVSIAYKDLESSLKDVKNQIENIKEKEKDKKADEKKIKDNEKTKDTPKMVKCEYCDTKNEANKSKCKSCGAPLK